MRQEKLNRRLPNIGRKNYENKDQAESRIKSNLVENAIINDFLENDVSSLFDPKNVVNSRYINSKPEDQKVFNQLAFRIISDSYSEDIEKHPNLSSIEFPNYVKLFNKSKDWLDELRSVDAKEGTPAYFFYDTFNEDMTLFRNAALEGYKEQILVSDQSKAEQ